MSNAPTRLELFLQALKLRAGFFQPVVQGGRNLTKLACAVEAHGKPIGPNRPSRLTIMEQRVGWMRRGKGCPR